MLAVEHTLGVQQLAVESRKRQLRRQHRMLDIEQAIIARLQAALLGEPSLSPGIGRVDADVDDLRHVHAPLAHHAEAFLVPIRVGDDVDCHFDAERAGEFERFEIAPERNALAEFFQSILIERFDAEKDVGDAKLLPELKQLLVAQEDIAARFQIETFAQSLAGDRLPDCKAVALLDEGDIVDDENAGLPDGGEILDHPLGADRAIAASIESPGAAERAVPRASAREFDGSTGVKDADEIFAALAQKIARRPHVIEVPDEGRLGPLARSAQRAGYFAERAAVAFDRFEQADNARLTLALEHAIDRACAVLQDGGRGERSAVAADADEGARQNELRGLGQIDNLGTLAR